MAHYLKAELYELIKKDERIFDFIQEGSLDGLWFWDLENLENKWMNERFWNVLGYDPEEMPQRARAWQAIIDKDDLKTAYENYQKNVTNLNYSYNQEVRYIHKNGSVVWLHCLGLVIRGENGKPLRMLGTAREITEQKQAFWKLKESEEKFRQIFEQSPLAIQLYNEKGDLLEVNLQTLELFGIADKEQIAKFNLWSSQDLTPEKTRQLKANKPIQIASIFDFELAKQHNIIQSKHTGIKQLDMFVAPILINEDVRGYLVQIVETTEQKNANKELQSQRDLLQIIINTVPSRIFWKDLNSVYIGCNTLFAKDAGKNSIDEVIGKNDDSMVWRKHAELYRADDREIVQSGIAKHHYEEPFINKEGEEVIWLTSKLPLKNTDGETFGLVAISENITAERLASKKLKESEERFRGIFEHANIGIAIADEKGTILDVNKGYLEITGYSYNEFVGLNYTTITQPDDLAKEKILIQEVYDGKTNGYRIEKRLKCKSGRYVWLDSNITSIRDTAGAIERLIALAVDITEKKSATESLNVFFEQPMNLHLIATVEGKILRVNSGWKTILGYEKEELVAFSFLDLVHPDDAEETISEMKALNSGKKTFSFENRYRHKDGHYVMLAWSAIANTSSHQIHAVAKDITEEKAYHQALVKSEENYKALSENANHIIVTYGFNGEITYANRYALNFMDVSKEVAIGADIREFVKEANDLNRIKERIESFKKGNYAMQHYELSILLPNGETRFLDVLGSPIKIKDKIESVLITAYDITSRKKAELKIKEQNEEFEVLNEELLQTNNELFAAIQREEEIIERFNLAMQATSDGLWDWDLLTNKVYFSLGWKRMLGYRDEELPNDVSVWEKITHPDDVKEAYDAFDKLVSNTITKFDIEYRMQHKDGHWINVLSRAKIFFNKQQQPIRVVGTHTDVTQTKIAANKLSESEEKLRLIIDNSPLGICINSMDGRFLSTNKAYQKIVGYSKEELQELTFLDLTHPDFVEQNLELYQGMASKKNMGFHIEKKYIRKDGSFIDARVHTGTILANDGEPMFGMAFVEDITELRKTMDDLKLAKEAAEESNALKTEFLHNMSHEIRTPMNGIMGFSNLLSEMAGQNEKQKNYISIIQNCSIQLLRIIDDILEISSLETKQLTILESEFDVNQFMMELFSIFDLKAKERNLFLYLTKELQNECSFIISDKAILEKILDNLLDNAFKFTSSGKIEFGYKIENTNIVFFVKDTGIGISKDKQTKIFERFSQESAQTAQAFGGLGLGLSIAKENAELLNGKLTLESAKGKGATFFVTIPYKTSNEIKEKIAVRNNEEEKEAKIAVLIAEDEEVNYLYLEAILESLDNYKLKLHHVTNGEEAVIKCLRDDSIKLVLMDMKMPIMDGYAASEKIRAIRPDLPIIAQTAYSTSSEQETALQYGCNDFISKPIDRQELELLILKYLKKL